MSPQEKFSHWLDHAQYDMDSAEVMLQAGRWLYVVFMCQQAIEKLVKGLYGLYLDFESIPRIHNIRVLFERFQNKIDADVRKDFIDLFDMLTLFYLNNRYPKYASDLADKTKCEDAIKIIEETKESFAWLLTLNL